MKQNFVGLIGILNNEELDFVSEQFSIKNYDLKSLYHIPMVGFMVTRKKGITDIVGRRNLDMNTIKTLVPEATNSVLPVIYYSNDLEDSNRTLVSDITTIFESEHYGALYPNLKCSDLILNILNPSFGVIEDIKRKFSGLSIGITISENTLNQSSTKEFISKIALYGKINTIILSSENDENSDISNIIDTYKKLSNEIPQLRIGFDLNFSPENIYSTLNKLKKEIGHTDFSILATNGVMRKEGYNLHLQYHLVKKYLDGASMYMGNRVR